MKTNWDSSYSLSLSVFRFNILPYNISIEYLKELQLLFLLPGLPRLHPSLNFSLWQFHGLTLFELHDPSKEAQPHPLETSDLYNWRSQSLSYSEKEQALISLLETGFYTYQPKWDNCQQLLTTLFTSENMSYIKLKAKKVVLGS